MIELWSDVRAYVQSHTVARAAWQACENGSHLLHWAGRAEIPRPPLVLGACASARLALPYVRAGELRPLRAIETAEAWSRGEATIEEVRKARDAAYASADADASAYASASASASAYAASASDAAASASDAAYAAYARQNARADFHKRAAQAVRDTIAWPVVAYALLAKGEALGESWLETVAHSCGITLGERTDECPDAIALCDLPLGIQVKIEQVSREMARSGKWRAEELSPYWHEALAQVA